jgi:hypothetical protein
VARELVVVDHQDVNPTQLRRMHRVYCRPKHGPSPSFAQ